MVAPNGFDSSPATTVDNTAVLTSSDGSRRAFRLAQTRPVGLVWRGWRVGTGVAVGVVSLAALLSNWSMPKGPVQTGDALAAKALGVASIRDERGNPMHDSLSEKIHVDINSAEQGLFMRP